MSVVMKKGLTIPSVMPLPKELVNLMVGGNNTVCVIIMPILSRPPVHTVAEEN